MGIDPYINPTTGVLHNRLGLSSSDQLAESEYRITSYAGLPNWITFDYDGFKAVHRHLFGQVYEWAGEPRTVSISKDGAMFCLPEHLDSFAKEIFDELARKRFPAGDLEAFADTAAWLTGELNALHPFREGNGRAMTSFLAVWAADLGFEIDFRTWDTEYWMTASIAAFDQNLTPMADIIVSLHDRLLDEELRSLVQSKTRPRPVRALLNDAQIRGRGDKHLASPHLRGVDLAGIDADTVERVVGSINQYRRTWSVNDTDSPLGPIPTDKHQQKHWSETNNLLDRVRSVKDHGPNLTRGDRRDLDRD